MDPKNAGNEEALSPEELLMFEKYIQFDHNGGQVNYQTNSQGMFSKNSFSFKRHQQSYSY